MLERKLTMRVAIALADTPLTHASMCCRAMVDFRKGHDGLAALVKNELRKEPFTGTVFVFRTKRADRLKLLYWDGTGLVMTYKLTAIVTGHKQKQISDLLPWNYNK